MLPRARYPRPDFRSDPDAKSPQMFFVLTPQAIFPLRRDPVQQVAESVTYPVVRYCF